MKKKPIWDLYCELTEVDKMRRDGLCNEITHHINSEYRDEFVEVFRPKRTCLAYWGSDYPYSIITFYKRAYEFGPTRQNLILLYAAYKGEL